MFVYVNCLSLWVLDRLLVLTVCFEQPVYTVKEDGGMLEVALVTSQSIKLNHNRPAVQILPINGSAHCKKL